MIRVWYCFFVCWLLVFTHAQSGNSGSAGNNGNNPPTGNSGNSGSNGNPNNANTGSDTTPATSPCTYFVKANNHTANCCEATGLCQSSSCTVFGFEHSARSQCNGPQNCEGYSCNFFVKDCENSGQAHCFGLAACDLESSKDDCARAGMLCLSNGNSNNFRICGSETSSAGESGTSGENSDGSVTGDNTGSSCCLEEVFPTCTSVGAEHAGHLTADFQTADTTSLLARLNEAGYGCTQPNADCAVMVCDHHIPDEVIQRLSGSSCSPIPSTNL